MNEEIRLGTMKAERLEVTKEIEYLTVKEAE